MNDVNPADFNRIQQLIKQEKYSSVEDFVEIAIRNQLVLESSRQEVPAQTVPVASTKQENYMAKIFRENLKTVHSLSIGSSRAYEPLWGLINRIAPAKIVLRALCNALLHHDSDWINLSEFNQIAISEASRIRTSLDKYEKKFTVTRGESLKMGFPQKDFKSQQRFTGVYVGRLRGSDKVDGVLGDLEFASIIKTDSDTIPSSKIGITDYGLRFAAIESPLIDKFVLAQQEISSAFSDEEVQFLLEHFRQIRPGEYEFLLFLLRSVQAGATDPKKISILVSKYMEKTDFTTTMISSIQAGAIARLVEMRLIRIVKSGIYTSYKIQESAITDKLLSENGIIQFDI